MSQDKEFSEFLRADPPQGELDEEERTTADGAAFS
jgi:hypothetical protein